MDLINNVIQELKDNKSLRESGKHIGIPMPFPRMKAKFPYITRGRYVIVTASSKIGKTQITDFIFLLWVFIFQKEFNTNLKFKIFYFSLEMSKEDKVKSALSFFLNYYKGIKMDPSRISSQYDDYILDDEMLAHIEDMTPIMEEFLEMVEFIDNIKNPTGIKKYCQAYAEENGSYTYKTIKWQNDDGTIEDKSVIDSYIPNDPDAFNIVITDHVSLLHAENNQSLHETMGKFSSDVCLKLRDRFKFLVVNVQQQAQSQEGVENMKLNMLKPSHNGLADNKLCGRDCDLMFGLFAPNRYNIRTHENYDISQLKDNYREFITILNRRGSCVVTDLMFDGSTNYFKELPKAEDMTQEIYQNIKELKYKPNLIN